MMNNVTEYLRVRKKMIRLKVMKTNEAMKPNKTMRDNVAEYLRVRKKVIRLKVMKTTEAKTTQ